MSRPLRSWQPLDHAMPLDEQIQIELVRHWDLADQFDGTDDECDCGVCDERRGGAVSLEDFLESRGYSVSV